MLTTIGIVFFIWLMQATTGQSLPTSPFFGGHEFLDDFVRNGAMWWMMSAAIRTMPLPAPTANVFYIWLYNFLQVVGANLDKIGKRNGNVG